MYIYIYFFIIFIIYKLYCCLVFLKSLCQPSPFRYHCSEVLRALDLAVKAESLRQAGPCSTELPDIESRNQRVMLTF